MFCLMNTKENRVVILRTTKTKLSNYITESSKPNSTELFQIISDFRKQKIYHTLFEYKCKWLLYITLVRMPLRNAFLISSRCKVKWCLTANE